MHGCVSAIPTESTDSDIHRLLFVLVAACVLIYLKMTWKYWDTLKIMVKQAYKDYHNIIVLYVVEGQCRPDQ